MNPNRLDLRASLLATGVATLGATLLVNHHTTAHEARNVVEQIAIGGEVHVEGSLLPFVGSVAVREQTETPGDVIVSESERTLTFLRPWAEHFADDPAAQVGIEASPSDLGAIVRNTLEQGEIISKVTVRGTASDEDDYAYINGGDNPGLGIASEHNVELADTRARAILPDVQQILREEGGYTGEIELLPGKEIVDKEFAGKVADMADQLGTTALSLVHDYNRNPESLPEPARKLLFKLDGDRSVQVTLHTYGEQHLPSEQSTDISDIKWVLAPLPILKRRRREEFEENETPNTPHSSEEMQPSKVVPAPVVKQDSRPKGPATKAGINPVFDRQNIKQSRVPQSVQPYRKQPRSFNGTKATQRNGGRMPRSRSGRGDKRL